MIVVVYDPALLKLGSLLNLNVVFTGSDSLFFIKISLDALTPTFIFLKFLTDGL